MNLIGSYPCIGCFFDKHSFCQLLKLFKFVLLHRMETSIIVKLRLINQIH